MLIYDGLVPEVSGLNTVLTSTELKAFEQHAQSVGLPYQVGGDTLKLKLRPR